MRTSLQIKTGKPLASAPSAGCTRNRGSYFSTSYLDKYVSMYVCTLRIWSHECHGCASRNDKLSSMLRTVLAWDLAATGYRADMQEARHSYQPG